MDKSKNGRPRYNPRPLCATVLLMTLLATYSLFLKDWSPKSAAPAKLFARDEEVVCDDVYQAQDQCAFVRAHCLEDEPGLVSYLTFYFCTLAKVKPIAFMLLALWLGLLFSTIGIAASDFFSVNLSTIASVLGLPESLAGVTFLAFGNGSPDVFSTFAAMNSNSGSMAIGELIGAAGFITAVVAGSMALVREFKVSRKTFVRDIVFFILAVSFTMLFLTDGKIHLWECAFMIGFYVFYVCFVVGWHWFSSRRQKRRTKEAASHNHYSGASIQAGDEIEPYHDDSGDDEDDDRVGSRRASSHLPDISALENGPRINADGSSQDDEDDDDQKRHIASEMTSSMRVNRPRGRRSHTTITPIRPSLVGALEFRSILSSLQRSRNMRMAPLTRGYSDYNSAGLLARRSTDLLQFEADNDDTTAQTQPSLTRDRALSSGDVPRNFQNEDIISPPMLKADPATEETSGHFGDAAQGRACKSPSVSTSHMLRPVDQRAAGEGGRERTPSPAVPTTIGGRLAPPDIRPRLAAQPPELVPEHPEPTRPKASTPALSLQIPSPKLGPSQTSSPALSPFPGYHDSPVHDGRRSPQRGRSHSVLAPHSVLEDHIPGLDLPESPKPVRWWPYSMLPPPHVLWRIMLPTMQGWREKSIWDKLFSVFSAPTVFFLVATLPVVETEDHCDDATSEDGLQSSQIPNGLGINPPAIAVENQTAVRPETEWQEYRRRSRSTRSRSSSASRYALSVGVTPELENHQEFPGFLPPPNPQIGQPMSVSGVGSEPTTLDDESGSWNRWLVALQLFTGPLFTMFIVWAKYMDQPVKTLVKMILYSLLTSLILLAVLLLSTSPTTKPRYHFLFCFLGFIIAIAWISTIAEEVVGVLKAVGVILGMSEAILGLTIFAVGNSVGDLVADITVARLGYPVMALSACFGGPMLNILLGIGLGGTYMSIKGANHHHKKHPDEPLHYKAYHIQVTGTLFISAITVLVTLITLLVLVPTNKWMMTRKIGLTLITLWTVSTIVNVIVEVTGVWSAVA
ncbi:sodium/calcium exchanger protein [Diaporthe amygdali]|uniref:sodium/calcium exchanger protein n=1 Tax=Phomopsis amygdali TaxID=1214568 RepID=UPI0022FDFC43|nr:sodium/calcium exchanger protein [Diaporthe amygdali]KAJ0121669.1 sodium/calcium exchanger protein [Diaporthe amygdali]